MTSRMEGGRGLAKTWRHVATLKIFFQIIFLKAVRQDSMSSENSKLLDGMFQLRMDRNSMSYI